MRKRATGLLLLLLSVFAFGGSWRYAPHPYGAPATQQSTSPKLDPVLQTPVSVNVKDVPLPYLFSLVSQTTSVPIVLREINYPSGGRSDYMKVSYFSENKPLWQVLDEITGIFDLWWKVEGRRIVVYKYETITLQLTLPLMRKEVNVGGEGVKLVYDRKFIEGIEDKLKELLYDGKSRVSVSETGFVFVRGRKSEVEAVMEAVGKMNESYTRKIPLKVKVALIQEGDELSTNFNFTSLLTRNFPISFTPRGQSGIFSVGIIRSDVEAFFRLLQENFGARIVEDAYLSALNGQPITFENSVKTRIISQYQLSYVAPSGGQTQQATPTVTMVTEDVPQVGSFLYIVPYYVGEGEVAIDLFRKGERLESLREVEINLAGFENRVALPTISKQSNVSQTVIERGETLVLFSRSLAQKEILESGIPFLKDIPLLGRLFKSSTEKKARYRVIMTLTFVDESYETSPVAEEPAVEEPQDVSAFLSKKQD